MPQHVDQRMQSWIGRTLIDRAGERIGRVEDIYTDDDAGHPAWIAVATGRFGLNIIFLPFAGATPAGGDELRVLFPKSLIKEAPVAGKGGRLTKEEVVRLYDHYGFDLEAEEVRERATHRRSSGLRSDYKPASPYVPVSAEEPPAPTFRPPAPAERPAPATRALAALAPVAAPAERVPSPAEAPAAPAAQVTAPAHEPSAPADQVNEPRNSAAPASPVAAPPHKSPAAPVAAPAEPPAAPGQEPSKGPRRSLFRDLVDLTDQPAVRPDSPLFWNHDDRIDSIRPPREPARGRR